MIIEFPGVDPQFQAIGHRVQVWRSARGMSLEDLAGKIGMPPGRLERAERGQCRLTSAQLYAVTLQLSIPMRLLFEDVEPGPKRH